MLMSLPPNESETSMSLDTILDETKAHGPWWLANMADVFGPDTDDSPGAAFLSGVRDAFVEAVEYLTEPTAEEIRDLDAHEYADSAVPIYTYPMWRTFVDLGAYQEDVEEFGEISDLTQGASVALYMIASRLFGALADEVAEALEAEDDDEDESVWCDDCGARLDVKGLCPSCLPNSERNPDEVA